MKIENKHEHDPVADFVMPDAYMLWALLAAEEVVGKQGLAIVLRQAGLQHLIDNYPPDELTLTHQLNSGHYADLFAGLLDLYGRAGKSILLRIGRLSTKHAIERQSALFNIAATLALKVMPLPTQIKMGLENQQAGLRKIWGAFGQNPGLRLEDRGETIAYIMETCPMCAGKRADGVICLSWTGALQESMRWLTGKEFGIEEVECRATGAPACVWEIHKQPQEQQ